MPENGLIKYERHGKEYEAPNLLEAHLVSDGEKNLKYSFFLEKPKEVAIMHSAELAGAETFPTYRKMGLQFFRYKTSEIEEIVKETIDFPIVIVDSNCSADFVPLLSHENIQYRLGSKESRKKLSGFPPEA